MSKKLFGLFLLFSLLLPPAEAGAQSIRVASKNFAESYILAEIMAQSLEEHGFVVERSHNLGGTLICYQALINRQVDLYPEYTGTIQEVILKSNERLSIQAIDQSLEAYGLQMLPAFGFNNSYALAVPRRQALTRGLKQISDLARWTGKPLNIALSYEFLKRQDGWEALRRFYGLGQTARGIEHGLAYEGLAGGQIDIIDVYSTDAEIQRYDLRLLKDDRNFFPQYLALPLATRKLDLRAIELLGRLKGSLSNQDMQALNAQVSIHKKPYTTVAAEWLAQKGLIARDKYQPASLFSRLLSRTLRHLQLTLAALLTATLLAIPIALFIYQRSWLSRLVLYAAGLLQTIPSIALLALMIPLLGIGLLPAVVALILYAILPILRSSITALQNVDPLLLEVADGLGLSPWQRLRYVELPLSLPVVFAGLRTSAVISVGTATLAAFIGAGGLGEPIVTGLALNDPQMILEGAVPAALLAILIDLGFDGLQRFIVPPHLQASV